MAAGGSELERAAAMAAARAVKHVEAEVDAVDAVDARVVVPETRQTSCVTTVARWDITSLSAGSR